MLYLIGIDKILDFLKIKNPYIFIFFVALVAGASMFTTSTFYITLAALSLQGHNPYLLGLFSGTGIVLGDTFFYLMGNEASTLEWINKTKIYKKLETFIKKQSKLTVQIFVFLYATISPLPNDIIMMILGATKFKYKNFIIPLFLGDVLFMTFASLLPGLFV